MLGSTDGGARIAGALGIPFVFAHHFHPHLTEPALALYRELFVASDLAERPRTIVAAGIVVGEDDEHAARLALPGGVSMLWLRQGRAAPLPTVEQAEALVARMTGAERAVVDDAIARAIVGGPRTVHSALLDLAERTGARRAHGHVARRRPRAARARPGAPRGGLRARAAAGRRGPLMGGCSLRAMCAACAAALLAAVAPASAGAHATVRPAGSVISYTSPDATSQNTLTVQASGSQIEFRDPTVDGGLDWGDCTPGERSGGGEYGYVIQALCPAAGVQLVSIDLGARDDVAGGARRRDDDRRRPRCRSPHGRRRGRPAQRRRRRRRARRRRRPGHPHRRPRRRRPARRPGRRRPARARRHPRRRRLRRRSRRRRCRHARRGRRRLRGRHPHADGAATLRDR